MIGVDGGKVDIQDKDKQQGLWHSRCMQKGGGGGALSALCTHVRISIAFRVLITSCLCELC